MRVRACEYPHAFVFVCVCACVCVCAHVSVCEHLCVCVRMCALLPHRCCCGVHDAVLEQPLLSRREDVLLLLFPVF